VGRFPSTGHGKVLATEDTEIEDQTHTLWLMKELVKITVKTFSCRALQLQDYTVIQLFEIPRLDTLKEYRIPAELRVQFPQGQLRLLSFSKPPTAVTKLIGIEKPKALARGPLLLVIIAPRIVVSK
jgi:hypothetical protein